MVKKLARIFGIVGGALTLLPYLVLIAECAYDISLPATDFYSREGQGYAYGFMIISLVPTLIAAVGLTGSFLVHKKHILAGVMLIASGALLLFFGLLNPYSFIFNIQNSFTLMLLSRIPNLLLIAGGVLSLVYQPKATAPPPGEPDSNTP